MQWLKKNYEAYPQRRFINRMTYREVYHSVVTLAEKLFTVTQEESRVALYADNSPEAAMFILAFLLLKKEVLLLNTHLTNGEVKRQTDQLGVQLIFSPDAHIPFKEVYAYKRGKAVLSWEPEPEQIAVIMNTSATAGKFKSVPLRWKQIRNHVHASREALGAYECDNWLMVLPIFHISGLSILFRSLYNAAGVTILNKFEEETVLALIKGKEINMVSLVPTALNRMIDQITVHNLRVILLGGEFISNQLAQKCLDKRLPVYKTYGMTETTSQSTTFCILDFPEKLDSVGRPLLGVEIAIRDADQEGIGEIWIKSPMLMYGYIGDSTIGGYFNTGDMGRLDSSGFLYVYNRRSDLIISGGENIYPKEIENTLYGLQEVKECAVAGREDDRWGQVPVLYLVSDMEKEEVFTYLSKHLSKYKMPKEIVYLEELPKNDTGKILRRELQRR